MSARCIWYGLFFSALCWIPIITAVYLLLGVAVTVTYPGQLKLISDPITIKRPRRVVPCTAEDAELFAEICRRGIPPHQFPDTPAETIHDFIGDPDAAPSSPR